MRNNQDTTSVLSAYLSSMESVAFAGTAAAAPELCQVFGAATTALGFAYFSYLLYCPKEAPHKLSNEYDLTSNLPDSTLTHAQRCEYFHDPEIRSLLMEHQRPFLWSRIEHQRRSDAPNSTWFDLARNAGLTDAVVASFPGVGGELAVMTLFMFEESAAAPATNASPELELLFLLSAHFHQYARPALLERGGIDGSIRRRSLLSEREVEVLEWTARGKSTAEIASILGLSSKSVEFHIEGCKRKLNVFNRTHAVAKAILLGLLKFKPGRSDRFTAHDAHQQKPASARAGSALVANGALGIALRGESVRAGQSERQVWRFSI